MSDKAFFIFLMIFGGIPMAGCLVVWISGNMELIGAACGLYFFAIGYAGYREERAKD